MSPGRRTAPAPITEVLARWGEGHRDALDDLVPAVYSELRRMARARLANERLGHTLQATALVNEVYLRLGSYQRISWKDRPIFSPSRPASCAVCSSITPASGERRSAEARLIR